ncbi:hypothetical protein [Maridesulfovibrio bastinii]|uniref:hypothetical protein n=1 Tax=Maridesulfovibrio bastinii TaxID=47157 RepID=UPI0004850E03|nr:hypothetical protein [Maridesulfovibrio bastinii]
MKQNKSSSEHFPGRSWEIFTFGMDALGESGMYRIFRREKAQMYRWGRNPILEGSQRNPIDRMKQFLQALGSAGEGGRCIAQIALTLMASSLDFKVVDGADIKVNRETVAQEFLAIHEALASIQNEAKDNSDPEIVAVFAEDAHKQIDAFVAHYRAAFKKEGEVRFSIKRNLSWWQRFKLRWL